MEALQISATAGLKRAAGIVLGLTTQLLFGVTVWYLYWFLANTAGTSSECSLSRDACLALQFAVPHSILLHPAVKKRLSRYIAPAFYGLMFCIVTCLSLLLLIRYWQTSSLVIWDLHGPAAWVQVACFSASWFALYYSIGLTGLGYQTGYTPWSFWLRGQKVPLRQFVPRGAYHFFRHPVYLSFLGLIWFTPRMTLDHALLTSLWTVYIFVGSWLKDLRLSYYLGASYQQYAAQTPGYPFISFGPLGLMRTALEDHSQGPTTCERPHSRPATVRVG